LKSFGQNFVPGPRRYFCSYVTMHGGVWDANWYPAQTTLTKTKTIVPGHDLHYGPLAPTTAGGVTTLSNVLQAPSTLLTSRLVSKINILRGLDYGWQAGHTPGGHLGTTRPGRTFTRRAW